MVNQPFTNEAGLLACLIHKPELYAQISSYLMPHHFQDGRYRKAYEEFVAISQVTKSPPDSTTWEHRLIAINVSTTDNFLLATIYQQIPIELVIPENITYYAKNLLNEWTRVNYLALGSEISQKMATADIDVSEAKKDIEQKIFNISKGANVSTSIAHISKGIADLDSHHEKRNSGELRVLNTGYPDLDYYLEGIEDDWVIVLAGATGMGKSSLALDIVQNIATDGNTTCVFSLEMMKKVLATKLIASTSPLTAKRVRKGDFTEAERVVYRQAADRISKLPIYTEDSSSMTVEDIEAYCRQLKMQSDLRLIVVDHLGLVKESQRGQSLYESMTYKAKAIKRIAGSLHIPVIEVVQLKRIETRQDKHPVLNDLKDSGEVENSADVVLFVYRDEYYNKETATPNTAEVIVAKNRHGETGQLDLYWDAQRATFKNLARENLRI